MSTVTEEKTDMPQRSTSQSVDLKRQVTIKTVVNDDFRSKAKDEFSRELQLIDQQLGQLDGQYQQSMQQLDTLAAQGQTVIGPLDQLNQEFQTKRNRLTGLKMEVSSQLANIDKAENGAFAVTGMLESFVTVNVGDNIYEKVQNCEVIIEDGVVKEIRA